MSYDPRGRTPAGRREQLAEMSAGIEARDRRAADIAHGPGGTADIFGKTAYWEAQLERAEVLWDRYDRRWRDLTAGYGRWPEPLEASEIAGALADRDRLAAECSRCKAERDAALAEFERFRSEFRDPYRG